MCDFLLAFYRDIRSGFTSRLCSIKNIIQDKKETSSSRVCKKGAFYKLRNATEKNCMDYTVIMFNEYESNQIFVLDYQQRDICLIHRYKHIFLEERRKATRREYDAIRLYDTKD